MARAVALGVLSVAGLLAWPPTSHAQCQRRLTRAELDLSTAELQRKVGIFAAVGTLANDVADLALDRLHCVDPSRSQRPRASDIAIRLARLYLVNLPIAAVTEGIGVHGAGHFSRAHDAGLIGAGRKVMRWPWPLPYVGVAEFLQPVELPPEDHTTVFAIVAGGEEAASVLEDRMLDKVYGRLTANYFDWVLLGYAKLDFIGYGMLDLRPKYFAGYSTFSVPEDPAGDFRQYALEFAALREESRGAGGAAIDQTRAIGMTMRRSVGFRLLDFGLWSSVFRVAQYAVRGDRESPAPVLRIGALGFVPRYSSAMTPIGIERGFSTVITSRRALANVTVGARETPSGRELPTFAMTVGARANGTRPRLQANVWKEGEIPTLRFSLGVGVDQMTARRIQWNGAVRYKSSGYLPGFATRRGVSASAGVRVFF